MGGNKNIFFETFNCACCESVKTYFRLVEKYNNKKINNKIKDKE